MTKISNLVIGKEYARPYLANLWGYKSFNAISRGVVTPRDENKIILFITKDKQESLTQYKDHIANDLLFWEGEIGHGNDNRLISCRDEIHVFYRERHHEDFIYKGRCILGNYRLYKDRPSKFNFQLIDSSQTELDLVAEKTPNYFPAITERTALIASRVGQGHFRDESIRLWHACCVSGFTKESILTASHIKPWRASDNRERLDGYNSLLLVPTYDRLFDKGYIGFDMNGSITISDKIDMNDVRRAGLNENSRLFKIPDKTMHYLEYHQTYIFDLVEQGTYMGITKPFGDSF